MSICPKHDRCSAPLCPVDPEMHRRIHCHGEPVCRYLSEAVKDGAAARFWGRSDEATFLRAVEVLRRAGDLPADVRHKLKRAAQTGSCLDRAARLVTIGGRPVDQTRALFDGGNGGCLG